MFFVYLHIIYGTYSGDLRARGLLIFWGELHMEKPFKTYDEQIQLLISRGIEISNLQQKSNAKKLLQHEGYYNLINGYSKLFLDTPNCYKSGTTMEEI